MSRHISSARVHAGLLCIVTIAVLISAVTALPKTKPSNSAPTQAQPAFPPPLFYMQYEYGSAVDPNTGLQWTGVWVPAPQAGPDNQDVCILWAGSQCTGLWKPTCSTPIVIWWLYCVAVLICVSPFIVYRYRLWKAARAQKATS
ncbi:hypothetical protein BCR44DRAFT_65188 [Catenaria anguillulae PL171]|uniref:Uncharacterized protein n=1 Tax=Catenaria anguillulae PL171 TaxID=765915 RepID=A0A1Y2I3J1_9FUNG|nr:hypothetical protein BCR44DRAFT_65188 [Catenaria anguillulae PL171]